VECRAGEKEKQLANKQLAISNSKVKTLPLISLMTLICVSYLDQVFITPISVISGKGLALG
jgi:hypothetical protein